MITLTLDHIHRERPPSIRVVCHAEFGNPFAHATWLFLPRILQSDFLDPATVNGIQCYIWPGEGYVACGEFHGVGNVRCLYLPPAARIVLSDLSFSLFEPFEEGMIFDVHYAYADGFRIGEEEGNAWFGISPLCDPVATVSATGDVHFSRFTPDRSEIPLHLKGLVLHTAVLRT